MYDRVSNAVEVLRLIVNSAISDRVTFLAASIAFYAMVSIFPLFLLILVVGSFVAGEAIAVRVVELLSGILTPEAEAVLETALIAESGRSGAGIAGVLLLTWSAIRMFRGLDIAFSQVYPNVEDPGFLKTVANAVIVLVAILVGVVAIFVVRTYLRLVPTPGMFGLISPLAVFVTLCVVFFPMYFVFPGERQRPLAVLPGTAFAALGWTLLGELFSIYAAHAGTFALFGVVGGVLLLLMWFYFGAVLLLLGAVLNAVLAGRSVEEGPLFDEPGKSALGVDGEPSSERE